MRRIFVLFLLAVPTMSKATGDRVVTVYPEIIGKDYVTARALLRKHGARPDDLRASKFRGCLDPFACKFPEYFTCFGDQPACVFIWRAPGGGFLRVQTSDAEDDADRYPVTIIYRSTTDQ